MKVYVPMKLCKNGAYRRFRPYLHAGHCTLKLQNNPAIDYVEIIGGDPSPLIMTREEWFAREK